MRSLSPNGSGGLQIVITGIDRSYPSCALFLNSAVAQTANSASGSTPVSILIMTNSGTPLKKTWCRIDTGFKSRGWRPFLSTSSILRRFLDDRLRLILKLIFLLRALWLSLDDYGQSVCCSVSTLDLKQHECARPSEVQIIHELTCQRPPILGPSLWHSEISRACVEDAIMDWL